MIYVLFHGNCYDGFGAAWACYKAFHPMNIQYLPLSYGQLKPDIPEGANAYMVDFSYPRAELNKLLDTCGSLVVLDHHKTAQEDLEGFGANKKATVVFDMDRSGAVIAWQYFFRNRPVPLLLQYIQDRDLWKFSLPDSDVVHAYISSYPRTFEVYDELARQLDDPEGLEDAKRAGASILRFKKQKVAEICDHAYLQEWEPYGKIPVVNSSCFMSEVAHELLERYPDSPFAAYYFDRPDKTQWGLRSRKDFDCSVVAKIYGGGGHAQASGFEI